MKFTRFEEIEAWKHARILANLIYGLTRTREFSRDIRFAGQIQAASVSVMANIAEGSARHSDREFMQFLYVAISSISELQSHLYLASDQKYISQDQFDATYKQAQLTAKLISSLITYLKNSLPLKPKNKQPTQIDQTDQTD